MLELRYYQDEAVDSIFSYFGDYKVGNPILAMPTGTGKSVVIAEFVRRCVTGWHDTRILVLTHVKELIGQNYNVLLRHWPTAPAGIYSAGLKRKDIGRAITFAGIASVAKHASKFGFVDLVLIDECHLVSGKENTSYRRFISALKIKNPGIRVVGLSATPYRLSQGRLTEGGLFTDVCFDNTQRESFTKLIDEGFLCDLIPKSTKAELDVSQVKITAGEYNQHDLQEAVDVGSTNEAIVREIIEEGQERRHWLVFCSGVEHAQHIAELLCREGYPCACVHSNSTPEERDAAIAGFKAGRFRAVTNNNILTTGFDFPALDLIAVARPTTSPGLWVQMLGRGTRVCAGKTDCKVLDFAGNTRRLGPINDPIVREKGKKGKGVAPVKVCPACGCYNHASATVCKYCQAEMPRETKLVEADTRELIAKDTVDPSQDQVCRVSSVSYDLWTNNSGVNSVRVLYSCGLATYREWICFEHTGYPGKLARDWWRCRTDEPVPRTALEALARSGVLAVPRNIRVRAGAKYTTIEGYDMDGTGFVDLVAAPEPPPLPPRPTLARRIQTLSMEEALTLPATCPEEEDVPF